MRLVCFVVLLTSSVSNAFFGMRSSAEITTSLDRLYHNAQPDSANMDDSLARLIVQQLKSKESFDEIGHTIESHTTTPTCSKTAYFSLVNSCRSLERDTTLQDASRGVHVLLDGVKSAFAARLAICELSEVGDDAIPPACSFLLDDLRNNRVRGTSQDNTDHHQMSTCVRGLHSDSRAWNSFTNAKQNAITICHATRAHIDRDAVLEQAKINVQILNDAAQANFDATKHDIKARQESIATLKEHLNRLKDAHELDNFNRAEDSHHREQLQIMIFETLQAWRTSMQNASTDLAALQLTTTDLADTQREQYVKAIQEMFEFVNISVHYVSSNALSIKGTTEDVEARLAHVSDKFATLDRRVDLMEERAQQVVTTLQRLNESVIATGAVISQSQEDHLQQLTKARDMTEDLTTWISELWRTLEWLRRLASCFRVYLYFVPLVGMSVIVLVWWLGVHRALLRYVVWSTYEIWRGYQNADAVQCDQRYLNNRNAPHQDQRRLHDHILKRSEI